MFISLYMFFSSILCLVFVRKHFLMTLLGLEFMLISLFYFLCFFFCLYYFDYFFCLMFLVLGVCEGVLGLSMLVYLVRKIGNDYFSSMNLC